MPSLEDAFIETERSIISEIRQLQAGIDDRTGKGTAAEEIIERRLLRPFLPSRFCCRKGSVVQSSAPNAQSPAIDRVIYDESVGAPLVDSAHHSIFPIETVSGLVEVTIRLNAAKLSEDVRRMAPVKEMTRRHYLIPVQGTSTSAYRVETNHLSPRSFIVGLPADEAWAPRTIAEALQAIERELNGETHVHGLYVLGIGFFETIPIENERAEKYRIRWWAGRERLFRFTEHFRRAFDRWSPLDAGWSADRGSYVAGPEAETL